MNIAEIVAAEGPHPEHAAELMLFGQFAGSWDVEVTDHFEDGTTRTMTGEWHFGWALQGRAIQDVWIVPGREYGMTVRFYDPRISAWRSTWIGPASGYVQQFVARQEGAEIVLSGQQADGRLVRWIFSSITAESFHWRNVISSDGQVWRCRQEMNVVRRAGDRP
ncbi:hypothetical protein KIPE111705_06070 [Kibdelosporangium persicum]|uniref:DUF1579 domain-containing protein n=1 Tax=Kibdelosporangium persicum TaxID=2698649 RepID=A0ABX2F321_9PSEU|nr:hypothetical protein [Kibdelosporangium persicum]NRN65598.1 hypothetical protein [Kibdelosporangium persicum]